MSLKIGRVGEDLFASLADVATRFVVRYLMTDEIAFPVVDFGALITLVLAFAASRIFGDLVVASSVAGVLVAAARSAVSRRGEQLPERRERGVAKGEKTEKGRRREKEE